MMQCNVQVCMHLCCCACVYSLVRVCYTVLNIVCIVSVNFANQFQISYPNALYFVCMIVFLQTLINASALANYNLYNVYMYRQIAVATYHGCMLCI